MRLRPRTTQAGASRPRAAKTVAVARPAASTTSAPPRASPSGRPSAKTPFCRPPSSANRAGVALVPTTAWSLATCAARRKSKRTRDATPAGSLTATRRRAVASQRVTLPAAVCRRNGLARPTRWRHSRPHQRGPRWACRGSPRCPSAATRSFAGTSRMARRGFAPRMSGSSAGGDPGVSCRQLRCAYMSACHGQPLVRPPFKSIRPRRRPHPVCRAVGRTPRTAATIRTETRRWSTVQPPCSSMRTPTTRPRTARAPRRSPRCSKRSP